MGGGGGPHAFEGEQMGNQSSLSEYKWATLEN